MLARRGNGWHEIVVFQEIVELRTFHDDHAIDHGCGTAIGKQAYKLKADNSAGMKSVDQCLFDAERRQKFFERPRKVGDVGFAHG